MILFRYLSREIFVTTFVVSLTLLIIVMSSRMVKYLAEAAAGDIAPEVLMSIMYFRIPSFLELVLPLGLFIGILLAYGRLYVDSEMAVISACGVSVSRLAFYTLIPAAGLAVLVAYMSLYATPAGFTAVNNIYDHLESKSGFEILAAGRFRVDNKTGRVTYVDRFSDDKKVMKDVFTALSSVNDAGEVETSIIFAEQGYIEVPEQYNYRYLIMENGRRYIGQPGEAEFQITSFSKYGQRLTEQKVSDYRKSRIVNKPTIELFKSNNLEEIAALQWRFSLPILIPIISLIALALSKTNHRQGRYIKMLPAFLIYIIYIMALNSAKNALTNGSISPHIGLWWVHGVFLTLAIILLYGGGWWRRFRSLYVNTKRNK
ncbi:LPS export ABC transporter permease LptF [Dasania marina]|uniref:LPS export ABC transporter permease LptF n=1 Tax=Dasania marina TaxID=471499 RepID=UPI0030D91EFA